MGSGSNRRTLKAGNLITLEGGEGSGKTTQSQLLHNSLINAGIETIITREPGGTPQSEEIRSLLVSGESKRWEPLTESLLHFASRNEHLVKVILPTLQAGRWVICDFVAPTEKARKAFAPDYVIWLDTIKEGRVVSSKLNELKNISNLPFDAASLFKSKEFEDTNKVFETPSKIDKHVKYFMHDEEIKKLAEEMQNV